MATRSKPPPTPAPSLNNPRPRRANTQVRLLKLLSGAAVAANQAADTQEALQQTIDLICVHTGWPLGHAYLVEAEGRLVSTGVWHLDDPACHARFREATEAIEFAPGMGLPGKVLQTGRPAWIEDVREDPGFLRNLADSDLGAAFAFPVLSGSEVVGVLEFYAKRPVKADASLLETMANIGAQLGRVVERQRAEKALRVMDARLAGIISIAAEAIISTDASQRIIMFNHGAEQIFGYSAQEAIGRPLSLLIPKRLRAAHKEHMEGFAESGALSRRMGDRRGVVGRRRSGEEFPVEASISQLHQNGDRVFTVVLRDVSEQARAEEALRASEERLQLATRASSCMVWDWDIGTGQVTWSDATQDVLRYDRSEVGSSIEWWYERIHPQDLERVVASLQRAVAGTGETWTNEYRFLRGDGTYASVLNNGVVVRRGRARPVRMVGSMSDVTERRREEDVHRLLSEASARLSNALDGDVDFSNISPLIVPAIADLFVVHQVGDGARLRRVAAARGMPGGSGVVLGAEVEEDLPEDHPVRRALGTSETVFVSDPDDPVLRSIQSDESFPSHGGGGPLSSLIVVPLVSRDRALGTITLATAGSGRWYGPGELVVAEDLAKRVALALDNSRLYRKTQRALQVRDEVLGIISHDLRSPLHTIRMSVSTLRDTSRERRTEPVKWFDIINRSVDRMNTLIENLLDASKIESGSFSVVRAERDLCALIQQAIELFQPVAAQSSVELHARLEDDLSPAWVDSDQILRVLSNLLSNAIKFSPKGAVIELAAERQGDEVRVAVRDHGYGIDPEDLAHVFERYWQARSGDRRGAGLGLPIARAIVEAHGGRIWAESRRGEGSIFVFTLPLGGPEGGERGHAGGQ
jgi:PAS domain S-box-containing protein